MNELEQVLSKTKHCFEMRINLKWLMQRHACKGQIQSFQRLFGEHAELTLPNLLKAVDAGLNLNWLARQLGIAGFQFKEFDRKAAHQIFNAINKS